MVRETPSPDHQPEDQREPVRGRNRRAFLSAAALALPATAALALSAEESGNAAPDFDETTDVIVVGGGAAGCVAAATARAGGASVLLCEKAGVLGGTSAKSGGAYWIPNNFDLQARGVADPRQDFLRYVARYSYPSLYDPKNKHLGLPEATHQLLGAFYDHANEMVEHMAALGALKSGPYAIPGNDGKIYYYPDYLEHVPENVTPRGRILAPQRSDGSIGAGNVLMAQLTAHVRKAGVKVMVDAPVIELVRGPQRDVTGVILKTLSGTRAIRARRGVIFCSGGYAHNQQLIDDYQPFPVLGRCALPTCTGDFVELGTRHGARLGNMSGAWRAQCLLEQALLYSSLPMQVWYPVGDSMFVVNRYGRRCFNEKRNYHDRTRQSYQFDATRGEYPNLFNFPIYDQRTAERFAGIYPLPRAPLGDSYVIAGDTLEQLASELDKRLAALSDLTGGVRLDRSFVPTLRKTFTKFNQYAREGRDPDYDRGRFPFDSEVHNIEQTPVVNTHWPANPYPSSVMHPLADKGPYYTMILGPAVLDTNGGPEIDTSARVIDSEGQPIPGLYGAGNCIASAAGNTYWGAGATLGSAMTFGYIAGRHAAARTNL